MKLVFLGTNGWYDSPTGNTVCALLDTNKEYIVLDAGNGIHKLDKYISEKKPIYLFLSHLHLDHVAGIHVMGKLKPIKHLVESLTVIVPPKMKGYLDKLINVPYTMPFSRLGVTTNVLEIGDKSLPSWMQFQPMEHSVQCWGIKITREGRTVSYGPDTGICDALRVLAKDVDCLITECAYKSGERNPAWPHLNPEDCATVAKESNVKKLILTHFEAFRYSTLEDRKVAQEIAQKIFPDAVSAYDGNEFII
jgi:ribonuclease BN (tRNA processing enzyme)